MRTVFFIPPLRALSGGLANIYTVARCLRELGGDVALCGPSPQAPGFEEAAAQGIPLLPWEPSLTPADTWCIPESWPNAMLPGLKAGARVLVYAQNWVYMLGLLPSGLRWSRLPLRYVAVSAPVAWFMRRVLALPVRDVLPAAVSPEFFQPGKRPGDWVRIAWMPRKNRALGEQIRLVAETALAENPAAPRREWVTIHNLPRAEVAARLATCHLFLSLGFPEGFGLPPLEAMASGCVPVGFTGFGGWEYMRQAPLDGVRPAHAPPCGLEPEAVQPCAPRPEAAPAAANEAANEAVNEAANEAASTIATDRDEDVGNGFFFADGDTLGTGLALARAICLAAADTPEWQKLVGSCRATAARYSEAAQKQAVARIFLGRENAL